MESREFISFFKSKAILGLWQVGTAGEDGVVDVPWEDWGPQNTRFLAEEADENCVCYVYGMRFGASECGVSAGTPLLMNGSYSGGH